MIQFPETAQAEWQHVAAAANAAVNLRKRIELDTRIENAVEALRIRHEASEMFRAELEAEDTPPVVIQTMAEYLSQNTPVLVDMIDGVMKEDGVTLMLGPSGSGKSTLAVQMIHSLLTGTDWLGQQVQQIAGSAGLLSYDQNAAIPINWMSQMGLPGDRVSVIDLNGKGNPLAVPSERAKIAAAWRRMRMDVVIIDSFSASYSGDQNDAGLTMAWYKSAKKFALTEVGAKALIVIVHSTDSAPLKPRGSTVHKDVADTVVAVTREPTNERRVQMVKYRAGLNQTEMAPVVVTAPDSVTHLVGLDLNGMTMAGMKPPVSSATGTTLFPETPEPIEAPEPDTESDEEVDDL